MSTYASNFCSNQGLSVPRLLFSKDLIQNLFIDTKDRATIGGRIESKGIQFISIRIRIGCANRKFLKRMFEQIDCVLLQKM
jgi:hypothetical protein